MSCTLHEDLRTSYIVDSDICSPTAIPKRFQFLCFHGKNLYLIHSIVTDVAQQNKREPNIAFPW